MFFLGPSELFIMLGFIVLLWYPYYRILGRIGKNRWLSLLIFIPGMALVLLWYIALTSWRVQEV
ncbi:hypothetical protein DRP07_00745 [Archaeoglobales archaeon]|nr:MAG: hypothetical protein DRP07_00745 [Archaeoglobales archaeon]